MGAIQGSTGRAVNRDPPEPAWRGFPEALGTRLAEYRVAGNCSPSTDSRMGDSEYDAFVIRTVYKPYERNGMTDSLYLLCAMTSRRCDLLPENLFIALSNGTRG